MSSLRDCNKVPRKTWTEEEDRFLLETINSLDTSKSIKWTVIEERFKNNDNPKIKFKSQRQCRERYVNCLSVKGISNEWDEEEDAKLVFLNKTCGNQWAEISFLMNRKSPNQVKNRYYTLMSNKIKSVFMDYYSMKERKNMREIVRKIIPKFKNIPYVDIDNLMIISAFSDEGFEAMKIKHISSIQGHAVKFYPNMLSEDSYVDTNNSDSVSIAEIPEFELV